MREPLNIPAAWKGKELFSREDWLYHLTADDLAALDRYCDQVSGRAPEEISKREIDLGHLGEQLSQIQFCLEHRSGACMIRGLPVVRYSEEQARQIFWAMALHLGTPLSQSAEGERIFSVRDEGYRMGEAKARGPNTRKRLSFHTDRCDVIAFLCLRQARSGGENQIVSSVTLYNEMSHRHPELTEVLLKPYYYQRHNVDAGNEKPWCRQPVFSFWEGTFAGCFLRVLIERAYASEELPDMTALQREALDTLEEVAAEPEIHVTFRQEPGDILLLNNWVTFHRREEFEDHSDPALRRHLLRIWLAVPNSRALDPIFRDNYGATEAGAIRGGMRPRMDQSQS